MMSVGARVKRAMVGLVAAAALGAGGGTQEAMAIQFGPGDLVLALYGNGTEYLQNVGTISSLTASTTPTTIALNSGALTAASGTNNVNWALYGIGTDFSGVGGAAKALSAFTALEQQNTLVTNMVNLAGNQSGLFGSDGLTNQTIPASDIKSFTSTFGTSNTLGGSFAVSTAGQLGGILNLISQGYTGGPLSQIGYAMLALNGSTLTIQAGVPAAVPVPAAVVLFGTGLIGLVGIARRSIQQQFTA